MSYCEICVVESDGKVSPHKEFRNSWGGAARIWHSLAREYLGDKAEWLFDPDKLWALQDNEDISPEVRAVLISTFDNAMIKKENFEIMAILYDTFHKTYPVEPGAADHLPAIAAEIRKLIAADNVQAVCFYWTSCGEYPWEVLPDDDEDGEPEPYDINKHHKHWYVWEHPRLRRTTGHEGCRWYRRAAARSSIWE